MIRRLTVILCILSTFNGTAQFTAIPDPVFEAFLISQGLDTVMDGQVLTNTIAAVPFMQVNETPPIFAIEDFTGIEDFTSLETLIIAFTNPTELDLSNSNNLEVLNLFDNLFLENLNINGCGNLINLVVSDNKLSTLNLSDNNLIETLLIGNNEITSLNVSHLNNLFQFGISGNDIEFIDLRNGNNLAIDFFTLVNNSVEACVFVDDVTYSEANWTNIDDNISFHADESTCESLTIEEVTAPTIRLYPNPATTSFVITGIENFQKVDIYDLSGKKVMSYSESSPYSLESLTKGIYLIEVWHDHSRYAEKLIVE